MAGADIGKKKSASLSAHGDVEIDHILNSNAATVVHFGEDGMVTPAYSGGVSKALANGTLVNVKGAVSIVEKGTVGFPDPDPDVDTTFVSAVEEVAEGSASRHVLAIPSPKLKSESCDEEPHPFSFAGSH